MKKNISVIILMMALAVCGCDSYLDRQPDDQLTSKNIFDKKTTTMQYLVNVYTYMPNEWSPEGYGSTSCIAITASDEASCAYTGSRFFALLNHNQLSPLSTHGGYRHAVYKLLYQGISEATYFMSKVGECPQIAEEERVMWHGEARFLRAFYYTELLKWNGPVIWLGDAQSDYSDPDVSKVDRTPWNTIVDWLCDEYDKSADELPTTRSPYEVGRATKGAALAMKARLLMFNASPLFNGQNGTGIYDDIVNKDGDKLFNTEYDEDRWKQAADAAKAVIDMNLYELVDDPDATPLENIHNASVSLNSPENIFTVQCGGRGWRVGETPVQASGYGGIGLTQKLVDAFAMDNGYYPISNMEEESYDNGAGTIVVDPRSDYVETGSQKFVNPFFATIPKSAKVNDAIETMNMFIGREPRFYANVFWSGQTWVMGTNKLTDVQFYKNGNSGPITSNNYTPTGYLCLKFIDPDLDTKLSKWGNLSWPVIRYADVLLMYIEALNEYDPSNPDILTFWNQIRHRAGVPAIGTDEGEVYPEIIGDKDLQRKYIRRERMVELCFEGKRYFDTRRWMIAEKEDNGKVVGCNLNATNHKASGEYWRRTSIFDTFGKAGTKSERVFTKKYYLLPMNQAELDRVPDLTQNYGW
ncbi:MAG TPA: hypothetical protein DCY24_08470 [Rikenellaceae bacterium]|nr:hypothetical protein [Rikenellaceae bacterium]